MSSVQFRFTTSDRKKLFGYLKNTLPSQIFNDEIIYFEQCTFSFQRSNNWAFVDASESIQRYRILNWQTRETLAKGVYGGGGVYTPAHKWKRKKKQNYNKH